MIFIRASVFALVGVLLSQHVFAATFLVPGSSGRTLQGTLDILAPSGDKIILTAAITENATVSGKCFELESEQGPLIGVINGTGAQEPALEVNGSCASGEVVIKEISFQLGDGRIIGNRRFGGGLLVRGGANVRLVGNIFKLNEATHGGGAAAIEGSSLVIEKNVFTENTAVLAIDGFSSGAFGAGLYIEDSFLRTIDTNAFIQNRIDSPFGAGVGLMIRRAQGLVELSDLNFFSNRHLYDENSNFAWGLGMMIEDSDVLIENSNFELNQIEGSLPLTDANIFGGGIHAFYSSIATQRHTLIVRNVTFKENEAPQSRGGGFYLNEQSPFGLDLTIENSVAEENLAVDGSGFYIRGQSTNLSFQNNLVQNNRSLDEREGFGFGLGAVYISNFGSNQVVNNRLFNNYSASLASALYVNAINADVVGNVIYGNSTGGLPGDDFGRGTVHFPNGDINFVNNTVVNNSTSSGAAFMIIGFVAGVNIANSIIFGNQSQDGTKFLISGNGSFSMSHSIVEDVAEYPVSPSIFREDPLLGSIEFGDFHPRFDSVAKDQGSMITGVNLPPLDAFGGARVVDSVVDIGAQEANDWVSSLQGAVLMPPQTGVVDGLENVLLVNGSPGDALRTLAVSANSPLHVSMNAPSQGPSPASFALYAWTLAPSSSTLSDDLPFGLGKMVFDTPLNPNGVNQPMAIWNNTGEESLGVATQSSSPAPSVVIDLASLAGTPLGSGGNLVLQGVIEFSGANPPAARTNGVNVVILP